MLYRNIPIFSDSSITVLISLITFSLLIFTDNVYASGVLTHLTIASRAHIFLPDDIKSFYSSYLAGAFHPDAFYNCLDSDKAGEEAHWPPFLQTAVYIYRKKLQKPFLTPTDKRQALQLKAFIYGIFTHQIADVSWHSLHSFQGLLDELAIVDFEGDVQSAHTFLDTGGDFILLYKLFANTNESDKIELLKHLKQHWVYPKLDVVSIYNEMGYPIILPELDFCMKRGYAALTGELSTSTFKFEGFIKYFYEKSPHLHHVIDRYFYGGLNDIDHDIQLCLTNLNELFDTTKELPSNPWDVCPIFREHKISRDSLHMDVKKTITDKEQRLLIPTNEKRESHLGEIPFVETYKNNYINSSIIHISNENILKNKYKFLQLTSMVPYSQFGFSVSVGDFLGTDAGVCLAVGSPYEELNGSIYILPLADILKTPMTDKIHSIETGIKLTPNSYPENINVKSRSQKLQFPLTYGYTSININFFDIDYLIVSEPGTSKLYFYSKGVHILTLLSKPAIDEAGSYGEKQLGHILTVDYNTDDNIPDVIYGSKYTDVDYKFQRGKLNIIKGSVLSRLLILAEQNNINNRVPLSAFIDDLAVNEIQIPSIYIKNEEFEQFASNTGTNENDIFITINSIGSVLVFDKQTSILKFRISLDSLNSNERVKSNESGMFGQDFIITGSFKDVRWVLISHKANSIDECIHCGSLELFVYEDKSISHIATISLPSVEDNSFSYLGNNAIKYNPPTCSNDKTSNNDSTIIFISSEYYQDSRGAVFRVDLKPLLSKYIESQNDKGKIFEKLDFRIDTQKDTLILGQSDSGYSNFGHDLKLFTYEDSDYISVSMPLYGYNKLSFDTSCMIGRIGLYKL
ncbi:hypothetical protein B5S32_g255 [[Candida] boidinii]|nr:hypothetical protein B5S32_g255 [[Candida] boidinii]